MAPVPFMPPPLQPLSGRELALEISAMGLQGVAANSMALDPMGFVNQAAGSSAGTLNQSHRYLALRSFTPSAMASAAKFQPVLAPSGVPQVALVLDIQNAQCVSKNCAQLGCLATGGVQISDILQQIH